MAEEGRDADSEVDDAIPVSSATPSSRSAILTKGERVNQTFKDSQVNVVSGDQHNTNITVLGQLAPHKGVDCLKFIEIVNDHTWQETASGICEDFMNENLREPDFEVYPQMKRINVDDYYKGRHHVGNSTDVKTHTGARKCSFRNQLAHEVGFHHQCGNDGKSITMEEIMASILKTDKLSATDVVDVTAVVASAGSGKTTLTRRIARKALEILSVKENNEGVSFEEPKLKMIHYIALKEIKEENCIKASNFLFDGLFEHEPDENQAFKWLVEHQSEAVIIFDGLDQARWDFEEDSVRKIKPYQKASTSTILYNILARNILRHVKIIVASREFKISELPALARPKHIITMTGFTLEHARKLFTYLIKVNTGEQIWKTIEIMSPRLLQLVSVPIFLILVAVVMGGDTTRPPPSTVIELYNSIISVLQSVENIRNRRQILSIINKLKAMAFRGMKDGIVVFDENVLKRFGVSASEVQDLMTKVPGNNVLSRHLMEGDFTFFFCHQSMQEFLAASFVSDMEFEEFSHFNDIDLHEERWSMVRRFVTGIVYMKSPSDLHNVSDQTKKRQLLAQSIRSQLDEKNKWEDRWNDRFIRMELYTAIYESDDGDLIEDLSVINVSGISLSRDEAHIVGSLAARNESLDSLKLAGCEINEELLLIIARCLKVRIKVKNVNLRYNNLSAAVLRSLLGHHRIESLSGKLDWKIALLSIDGYDFELRNEEDVINISGNFVEGDFNITESTLAFETVPYLAVVIFYGGLFNAKLIKLNEQQHLYAKQNDMWEISKRKLEKISKILLYCADGKNIDWSFLETFMKKYQLDLLDIAVDFQASNDIYLRNLERDTKACFFGFQVNIHAMFFVEREEDFKKIVEACQQNKIEYIRCILYWGCRASLDEISSLVNNPNSRKVTLINCSICDMLGGDELTKVRKISTDLDTELEVLYRFRRVKDAWERLDEEFYYGWVHVTNAIKPELILSLSYHSKYVYKFNN